jgi:hypothetical protein
VRISPVKSLAVRVMAVDWSGKDRGDAEHIWLAEVRDGELVTLENGRTRTALIEHIIALAEDDPDFILGFDFAFSFPKWWCQRDWFDVRAVWREMDTEAEGLLATCDYPFWGREDKTNPHPAERRFRRTERIDTKTAKSVFQIGGAGAVGT